MNEIKADVFSLVSRAARENDTHSLSLSLSRASLDTLVDTRAHSHSHSHTHVERGAVASVLDRTHQHDTAISGRLVVEPWADHHRPLAAFGRSSARRTSGPGPAPSPAPEGGARAQRRRWRRPAASSSVPCRFFSFFHCSLSLSLSVCVSLCVSRHILSPPPTVLVFLNRRPTRRNEEQQRKSRNLLPSIACRCRRWFFLFFFFLLPSLRCPIKSQIDAVPKKSSSTFPFTTALFFIAETKLPRFSFSQHRSLRIKSFHGFLLTRKQRIINLINIRFDANRISPLHSTK